MRKIKHVLPFLVTAFALFFCACNAHARPIIAGISTNEINITSKFNGTKIVLFGMKNEPGSLIIVVRGPKKYFLVTKKEKIVGIWYNAKRALFKNADSYYSLFENDDETMPNQQILSSLDLGQQNLHFDVNLLSKIGVRKNISDSEKSEFYNELIHYMQDHRLYSQSLEKIDFLDDTLFRLSLDFPKNILRGIYSIEVYLINNNKLAYFQSMPVYVNQVGLSAQIFDYSYQHPFFYGFLAVLAALIIGWITNAIFTRFFCK